MSTEFYRYVDVNGVVMLDKYRVLTETPCGVWLHKPYTKSGKQFVLLRLTDGRVTHKRFACPTTDEAKVSFLARKRRQLAILKAQIANVEQAVENMQADRVETNFFNFS
jgi:hypothetical protein